MSRTISYPVDSSSVKVHAGERIDLWYTDSVIGGRDIVAIRLYAADAHLIAHLR